MAEIDIREKFKDIEKTLGFSIEKIDKYSVKYYYYQKFVKNYINDLVFIEDRDAIGSVIDFQLWPTQEDIIDMFLSQRRVMCLKARQLGITWLALSFASHNIVFFSGSRC